MHLGKVSDVVMVEYVSDVCSSVGSVVTLYPLHFVETNVIP